ncbi:MAG TPA: MFS transporter [Pyrinomonadaceae bacterium]|nr:MFS transporter [Pyrinomonadaceae bacterium]
MALDNGIIDGQSTLEKFTSHQILVILLLAMTQFTVVLDFMVMSPLGDMLMKSMTLTTTQFGAAVSAYAFSAGVSGLLTAGFADRFDRKKLLLFFYVGFIGGTFFCGLTTSYPMLIGARIVTGLFGGVIGSISMAIVADLFPLEKRGRVMGYMQMGFGASQVLGIPISLFIANIWGWQSPFLAIVALSVIVWLLIILKMQPINKHLEIKNDKNAFTHLVHTLAQGRYRLGFLATALLTLGGFMMMPWSSAFAINNLLVTQYQLPILFMVSGVVALVVMPLIGRFSDTIDKLRIFTIASVWLMIMVVVYTNMVPIPFWLILVLNILFMIGILSRMVPAMALVSALPAMQDRGAFMSINSSLQQMAGGVAAIVGGMIVVQKDNFSPLEHYDSLGYIIVVLSFVCIYMVYLVNKTVTRQPDQPPAVSENVVLAK